MAAVVAELVELLAAHARRILTVEEVEAVSQTRYFLRALQPSSPLFFLHCCCRPASSLPQRWYHLPFSRPLLQPF